MQHLTRFKFFRWSIRSQLVAVLAVAVLCALILPPFLEMLEERRLEKFWLEAGGFVSKDKDSDTGNTFFGGKYFDVEVIPKLQQIPCLTHLYLMDSNINDEDFAKISELKLPDLSVVVINDTPITDIGIQHAAKLKHLRSLHLKNTHLTDESVSVLTELVGLNELDLRGTKISHESFERLKSALPKTTIHFGHE